MVTAKLNVNGLLRVKDSKSIKLLNNNMKFMPQFWQLCQIAHNTMTKNAQDSFN